MPPKAREQDQATDTAAHRLAERLMETARSLGWSASAHEDALTYMLRRTREIAIEDCAAGREKMPEPTPRQMILLQRLSETEDFVDVDRNNVDDLNALLARGLIATIHGVATVTDEGLDMLATAPASGCGFTH